MRWKKHNSCERRGHINRFSECCALKKGRTLIHQRVYSLDAHYQTLTFLYFCFLFVSKCTPRNQLNQAETQNSNERQIAVGASKPNLVDVFVLKKSQTLWGYIGSSSDKSSAILYWIKRSANDRNSSVREKQREQQQWLTCPQQLGDRGKAQPPLMINTSTHAANKTNNIENTPDKNNLTTMPNNSSAQTNNHDKQQRGADPKFKVKKP